MPKQIVKSILRRKMVWGTAVIILTQILGMLPALDFLPANWLKVVSFALGCGLTAAKGIEMFYGQVAELEENSDTQIINKP